MKKLALVLVAVALVFSTAISAAAVEVENYGFFAAYGLYTQNPTFDEDGQGEEYVISQRLRPFWDFIANENLKATLGLELDQRWGDTGPQSVRGMNADFAADDAGQIEIKRSMLDFNWPETDVNIRLGVQGFALPGGVYGTPVLGADMAAAVISAPINDMVSLSTGFIRGYSGDGHDMVGDGLSDEVDAAYLSLPVNMDGWSVNPYFLYSWIGEDVTATQQTSETVNIDGVESEIVREFGIGVGAEGASAVLSRVAAHSANVNDYLQAQGEDTVDFNYEDDADAFWIGSTFSVDMFDPIVVNGNLVYGSVQAERDVNDREGWFLDLGVEYRMDNMTPTLYGMYSSGDDDDLGDGSETFPTLFADGTCAAPHSQAFGFNCGFGYSDPNYTFAQYIPQGIWQIGFALKDLTFMDKLSHTFAIGYTQGTNDLDRGELEVLYGMGDGFSPPTGYWGTGEILMTDDDSAVEVRFDHEYKIYENLSAMLNLGYAAMDMDSKWGDDYLEDDNWMVNGGFMYSF